MSVQSMNNNQLKFLCNSCLRELKLFDEIPSTGGHAKKCYWTNCKHVLCHMCRIRISDKCAACNQKCKFMEINRQMQANFRTYFEPQMRLRENLIGSVRFQLDQSQLIIRRTVSVAGATKTKARETAVKYKEIHDIYRKSRLEKQKFVKVFSTIRDEKKRRDARKQQIEAQWERGRRHGPNRYDSNHPVARIAHRNQFNLYDNHNESNIPRPNEPWTPGTEADGDFVDSSPAGFGVLQRPINQGNYSTPEFP